MYTYMTKYFFRFSFFFLALACQGNTVPQFRVHPANSKITTSQDTFYEKILPGLSGKKLMLATNPSGIGTNPTKISQMLEKHNIKLEHLIGLEHGFLGLEEDFSQRPLLWILPSRDHCIISIR